jgi:hypothetical protein
VRLMPDGREVCDFEGRDGRESLPLRSMRRALLLLVLTTASALAERNGLASRRSIQQAF